MILWGDGPAILADALGDPIARSRRWPVDLFDAAGVGPVTLPAAAKVPDYKPSKASRATWAAAAEAVELERVQRGQRNIALFEAVRFWAYSVARGGDLDAWTRRVRVHSPWKPTGAFLSRCRRRRSSRDGHTASAPGAGMAVGQSITAALHSAGGVKSGKVRRARVASRDRAIVEAYGAGASMRAVAREWELTEGAIRHVLGRGVRNEPNQ